eukprot:6182157-Pleurochrysis_carterae.AAC.4
MHYLSASSALTDAHTSTYTHAALMTCKRALADLTCIWLYTNANSPVELDHSFAEALRYAGGLCTSRRPHHLGAPGMHKRPLCGIERVLCRLDDAMCVRRSSRIVCLSALGLAHRVATIPATVAATVVYKFCCWAAVAAVAAAAGAAVAPAGVVPTVLIAAVAVLLMQALLA